MSDTTPHDESADAPRGQEPAAAEAPEETTAPRVDDAPVEGAEGQATAPEPGPASEPEPAAEEPPAPEPPVSEPLASAPAETVPAPAAAEDSASEPLGAASEDAAPLDEPELPAPVSAGTHASAESTEPLVPATAVPVTPQPIYVTVPARPKPHGNRGLGSLIALLGAVVFALVYAAVVAVIGLFGLQGPAFIDQYIAFLGRPIFWIPVIFFAIAMVVLVQILGRARWWAYIIGGFFVAAVVYFSFVGGALLDAQAWKYTPEEAARFLDPVWTHAFAFAAAITAREVSVWTGAWLAARGRRLTARNAREREEYERRLAEGPTSPPAP